MDHLVGVADKLLKFCRGKSVKALQSDPMVSGHVRSGNNSFAFNELGESFGRAFE
jgi:hypothetical protein